MGIGTLRDLTGEWELAVDLPGAADVRGHVVFETIGEVLVQRTTVPVQEALGAALSSPEAQAAVADVPNFATGGVTMFVAHD